MANADAPFGLRPVGHMFGLDWTASIKPFYVPASYGTAVFKGDPVTITGTANTAPVKRVGGGDYDVGTLPEVNVTTVGDGNAITGVVVGVQISTQEDTVYGAASTERVVTAITDPYVIYEIQADGAIPATSIGLNAVLIATHSGSTSSGLSGMELDTTSDVPAADASNQLTILRQVDRVDNEPNSTHNNVLVRINQHTYAIGAVGV